MDEVRHKTVSESRVYQFDFTVTPEVIAGQTVSSPTVTAAPEGLTIGTPTVSSGKVNVRMSAGEEGVTYLVRCKVNTSGSSTLEAQGYLHVSDFLPALL